MLGFVSMLGFVAMLAATLAALSPGRAAAQPADGPWSGVTVTDQQGWTLRNVTLLLSADGAALIVVRGDGAEKELAFEDVALVLDAEGRDITDEVLTGIVVSDEESEVVEEAPAPPVAGAADGNPEFAPAPIRSTSRRPGRAAPPQFGFAVDLGGGVADVTGDWFANTDDGAFIQGGVRVGLSDRRYAHFIVRQQSLGSATYYYGYDIPPIEVDIDMGSYQLLIGRHTPLRSAGNLRSVGYFEAGGGIMRVTGDAGRFADSLSRFGFAMQAGLWLMASDDVAVDLGLHAFYKPGWISDDEAGGTSLGLHVAGMLIR